MIHVVRETHDTPETVAHRLERAGGVNRFGEPNYRAVWGWSRLALAWIGGKFEDRDEHGALLRERVELRWEPKYPAVNRWHIERWLPPEVYGSPRAWYAQTIERENGISIPALGPYPSRGEYEHCFSKAREVSSCNSRQRPRSTLPAPSSGRASIPARKAAAVCTTVRAGKSAATKIGPSTSSTTPSPRSTNSPSSRWLNL